MKFLLGGHVAPGLHGDLSTLAPEAGGTAHAKLRVRLGDLGSLGNWDE